MWKEAASSVIGGERKGNLTVMVKELQTNRCKIVNLTAVQLRGRDRKEGERGARIQSIWERGNTFGRQGRSGIGV